MKRDWILSVPVVWRVGVTLSFLCVYRYNVVSPADGSWGSQGPNGTWSGMVGQVNRQVRSSGPWAWADMVVYCADTHFDEPVTLKINEIYRIAPYISHLLHCCKAACKPIVDHCTLSIKRYRIAKTCFSRSTRRPTSPLGLSG